jgi:hypothetical protein
MTEPNAETEATGTPEVSTEPETETTVGNEAAKYRHKLRATEAERDALATRLEGLQRGEIQRLAGDRIVDPADLWRDGATVAELLDDTGDVSGDKVDTLVSGLLEAHPHWAPQTKTVKPLGNLRSGATAQPEPKQTSWSAALRNPNNS